MTGLRPRLLLEAIATSIATVLVILLAVFPSGAHGAVASTSTTTACTAPVAC